MLTTILKFIFIVLFALTTSFNVASAENENTRQQAPQFFHFSTTTNNSSVLLNIQIEDGYFLNKNNLQFSSNTTGIEIGEPSFQTASNEDGNYKQTVDIRLPLTNFSQSFKLLVRYVGCSEEGFCFPPERVSFDIQPAIIDTSDNGISSLQQLFNGFSSSTNELLEPDKAFSLTAEMLTASSVSLDWNIAEGYYLYQDKVNISVNEPKSLQLGQLDFPTGVSKHDETFGNTVVYYNNLALTQPLTHQLNPGDTISLSVSFQGCADIGVCYPPMNKTVELLIPHSSAASSPASPPLQSSLTETDQIANSLLNQSFWWTCLILFGAGLALSFTPCVFPMIPILSGIIIGHGENLTHRKAFYLSLSYVIAAAITYAIFGVLAGLFGSNLQATFQNPWILSSFSLIFVLLALSMFGLYELQLPAFIQSKLARISQQQKHGSLVGSFMMGSLSALIVGPCVAAPLAGVLIYIGQTGDAFLGGFALFSLGLGMGVPLIIIGISAGKLLPKAGKWMEPIKYFFGVMLIAVAIWLMERILPGSISLALWAGLLIICAIYLHAIDALAKHASGWQKLAKGVGVLLLTYGIIMAIGAATGGSNPLRPLANISLANKQQVQRTSLQFQRINSLQDFNNVLATAAQTKQTVMLDFYADWCITCKEMEHLTFTDPQVKQALANTLLIQADVTANNTSDRELLNQFKLIGPPAILFFNPSLHKQLTGRVIGYLGPNDFLAQIKQAL